MTSFDQYESLAALYDILIPDPPGMLEFYRDLAQRHAPGGPVLEVGAGTGRLSLVLAAAGHQVTAVDASATMLAVLRAKADRLAPTIRDQLEVVVADQVCLDLRRRFPVVLITGGTLQHCLTSAAYAATLAAVRAHMDEGGILALDIARMPEGRSGTSFRRDYTRCSGAWLTSRWVWIDSWDEIEYRPETGVTETRSFFRMSDDSGSVTDRFRYVFRQTFPDDAEVRSMLERAGFAVVAMTGGFLDEPLCTPTDQLVATARAQ